MSEFLNAPALRWIDESDRVDVASFDSFPASDAPAWIASELGSRHAVVVEIARNAPANAGRQIPNEVGHAPAT